MCYKAHHRNGERKNKLTIINMNAVFLSYLAKSAKFMSASASECASADIL